MKEVFSSTKEFRLWNATASHNKLLLRSYSVEYGEQVTVDVIFVGVTKINLPTTLIGLRVFVKQSPSQSPDISECEFVITTDNVEYGVEAYKVVVYLSDVPPSFDSLDVNVDPDLLGVKVVEHSVKKQ